MHLHKWVDWEYHHDVDYYVDGYFHRTGEVWRVTCAVCKKPKYKKVRKS
jgi:hypothetical protein